mmetsp:Transcript_1680/g.2550  ORF Transcript_1680/g.2550 Transcript_1680/m.2550 type:complete len:455 (+) Transcript_1680:13-1377(+)
MKQTLHTKWLMRLLLLFQFFASTIAFLAHQHLHKRNVCFIRSCIRSHDISYFTDEIANEPSRKNARTRPDASTKSIFLYLVQLNGSIASFVTGIPIGIIATTILVALEKSKPSSKTSSVTANVSTSKGGSRTAILALWGRAQQANGPDEFATLLLQQQLSNAFGSNTVQGQLQTATALACSAMSRLNYQLTRGVFEDQVGFFATLGNTGLVTPLQCRTCWFDDCVEAFVRRIPASDTTAATGNVVILGSGYDTRCYRMNLQQRGIQCYEIDAPGTLAEKQTVLRNLDIDTVSTSYVPCDFESQDWFQQLLTQSSFNASLPTLLIWEGVTMYLSRKSIIKILQSVSDNARLQQTSWYIAFDFINKDWAMSSFWSNAMKRVGEPFQFAVSLKSEGEVLRDMLKYCRLEMLEYLTNTEELSRRYSQEHWQGRKVGIVGRYGGFVVAGYEAPKEEKDK